MYVCILVLHKHNTVHLHFCYDNFHPQNMNMKSFTRNKKCIFGIQLMRLDIDVVGGIDFFLSPSLYLFLFITFNVNLDSSAKHPIKSIFYSF